MNGIVWIAQVALAAIFLIAGTFKLFAFAPTIHALQSRSLGVISTVPIQAKLIGLIEVTLAFGVLMPDVFTPQGFVPEYIIVRVAAAGLAALMIAAGFYHVRRREPAALAVSVFLLALFVIVGRWPY